MRRLVLLRLWILILRHLNNIKGRCDIVDLTSLVYLVHIMLCNTYTKSQVCLSFCTAHILRKIKKSFVVFFGSVVLTWKKDYFFLLYFVYFIMGLTKPFSSNHTYIIVFYDRHAFYDKREV